MLSAKLLNQSVITAAAAYGALCADAVGDELENGFGVVVKTTHDRRVYGIFNACGIEVSLNGFKMLLALLAEVIGNLRRTLGNLRANRGFAVEDSHRVFLKT